MTGPLLVKESDTEGVGGVAGAPTVLNLTRVPLSDTVGKRSNYRLQPDLVCTLLKNISFTVLVEIAIAGFFLIIGLKFSLDFHHKVNKKLCRAS